MPKAEEVRCDASGDGYEESAQGLDGLLGDQEVNVFAVDCSTEATSQLIARATADDQDGDDETDMPSLVSSDSENDDEGDEASEEKHEEVTSGSSATTAAPPPTKIGPNLRRRMNGFALLPPPITPAAPYYRKFPNDEVSVTLAQLPRRFSLRQWRIQEKRQILEKAVMIHGTTRLP